MKTSNNTFKRTEMKYIITKEQRDNLLNEIKSFISPDIHKAYTICNLYCDTDDSRLIRNSIDRPLYKEKIRSRSYGKANKEDKVFLELKKKFDGIVYKRRISIKEAEVSSYFDGSSSDTSQINKEINYFLKYYKTIKPKMYIAYDREAYFATEDDTLRITFDTNILWRTKDLSLSSEIYGRSLLKNDEYVLEIKGSYAMPLWLSNALAKNKIYKSKYSKYGKAYIESVKENLILNKERKEVSQYV